MMIVSFAWTTSALLRREKTVTRRFWDDGYARRFHGGDLLQAYDRSPRNGGKRVAIIRLTCDPYRERLADMPESDVAAEGGLWVSKAEFVEMMGGPDKEPYVLRFELVSLTEKTETRNLPRTQIEFAFTRKE